MRRQASSWLQEHGGENGLSLKSSKLVQAGPPGQCQSPYSRGFSLLPLSKTEEYGWKVAFHPNEQPGNPERANYEETSLMCLSR